MFTHSYMSKQFYIEQFSLVLHFYSSIQIAISAQFKCEYSIIVKNISISNYSVYSNSSNSANSLWYKYRICLHTVKCQNSSILNNSV